jgi:hypothetical protein
MSVVRGGGMHEVEVHVETMFPFGSTNRRELRRALLDRSLFLMVDVMEWVMVKCGQISGDATR